VVPQSGFGGKRQVGKKMGRRECGWAVEDESGESIIGTREGVVKCSDFRRRPDGEQRWKEGPARMR
jgi:hypothetical protein